MRHLRTPDEASAPAVSDRELLRIEIETLWATDDRGRIEGRDLVIGSSAIGNTVAVASAVAADLAAVLVAAVTAAWAALMRPTGRHLLYSVARTNVSSQRVAARLGLRPIGWLWQLAAPRP
jgi:hypothetical protein